MRPDVNVPTSDRVHITAGMFCDARTGPWGVGAMYARGGAMLEKHRTNDEACFDGGIREVGQDAGPVGKPSAARRSTSTRVLGWKRGFAVAAAAHF